MDLAAMRTRVQTHIRNSSVATAARVLDGLNEAVREHALSFDFYELRGVHTFSSVAGTAAYTTPTDLLAIRSLRDLSNDCKIPLRDIDWLEDQSTEAADGIPFAAVRINATQLELYYQPDSVYNYRMKYTKRPTALASDTDVPEIPEEWHPALVLRCASVIAYENAMDEKGLRLKNEWLGMTSGLQEEPAQDARRRTSGRFNLRRTRRPVGYGDRERALEAWLDRR